MPLQRGEVRGFNFDRMVVEFTMLNQDKVIECAISTAAMDDLEGKHEVKADQRIGQFLRLHSRLKSRKIQAVPRSRCCSLDADRRNARFEDRLST